MDKGALSRMNKGGAMGRFVLFSFLILSLWGYTGCETTPKTGVLYNLKPKFLNDTTGRRNYLYFLSKDIVLEPVLSTDDPAFRAAPPESIILVERNGILTLKGAEPAFSSIYISRSASGKLLPENWRERPFVPGVQEQRGNSVVTRISDNYLIIRVFFGNNNDEFLEFAGFNDKPSLLDLKDRKFYLLFYEDRLDKDPRTKYVLYNGRKYTAAYKGNVPPYLRVIIPAKGVNQK